MQSTSFVGLSLGRAVRPTLALAPVLMGVCGEATPEVELKVESLLLHLAQHRLKKPHPLCSKVFIWSSSKPSNRMLRTVRLDRH